MASVRWAWMSGLVAALVAASVHAQHRDFGDVYVGAALAYHVAPDVQSMIQRDIDADPQARGASVSVDEGVLGWGVYGGFAVTEWLALEAGYLGNADMETTLRGAMFPPVEGDFSLSMFHAAVVAGFPMPRGSTMYPFVKAGVARWNVESSFTLGGITITDEIDGTDPLFGVGVDVPGLGAATFRGEYTFFLIDDDDGEHHHRFQAGVNFTF